MVQQPVIHMWCFLILVGCPPLNTFLWSFPQICISMAAFMCEHPLLLFSVSSGGCRLGNLVCWTYVQPFILENSGTWIKYSTRSVVSLTTHRITPPYILMNVNRETT